MDARSASDMGPVDDYGTARLQGHPNRMLCERVVLDRACACDDGPATTETAARLANMRCELGAGELPLIQCVLRVVRNDARLQMFRHVVDTDCRDTPRFDEMPCLRMRMCVGMCGYACTCARA
jgi:hypothetical protein